MSLAIRYREKKRARMLRVVIQEHLARDNDARSGGKTTKRKKRKKKTLDDNLKENTRRSIRCGATFVLLSINFI